MSGRGGRIGVMESGRVGRLRGALGTLCNGPGQCRASGPEREARFVGRSLYSPSMGFLEDILSAVDRIPVSHIAAEVSVAIPERAVAEAGHAMKASVVCAGVLLLLFAGEAVGAGSGNSGDDIMPGCRGLVADSSGNLGDFRQGICAGSINAIIRFDPDICLPKGSTVGQAVRVVVQYIDSQPARLHEDFVDLAAEALRAAWPCPAQR